MEKICYTIGEVAELLGESTSLVRCWSDSFSDFVHPRRNAKGNRQFSPADVEVFRKLHFYIKEKGMTLDGAGRMLKEAEKDNSAEIAAKLSALRDMIKEVRDKL